MKLVIIKLIVIPKRGVVVRRKCSIPGCNNPRNYSFRYRRYALVCGMDC